jgi:hypothetical protein
MRTHDGWRPSAWIDSRLSRRIALAFLSHGVGEAASAGACQWEAAADLVGARLAAQLPGVFQVLLAQPFGRAKDIVLRHVG